jgi:hypothetical protein
VRSAPASDAQKADELLISLCSSLMDFKTMPRGLSNGMPVLLSYYRPDNRVNFFESAVRPEARGSLVGWPSSPFDDVDDEMLRPQRPGHRVGQRIILLDKKDFHGLQS